MSRKLMHHTGNIALGVEKYFPYFIVQRKREGEVDLAMDTCPYAPDTHWSNGLISK